MSGAGTGYPLSFACSKCRLAWRSRWDVRAEYVEIPADVDKVDLTGKERDPRNADPFPRKSDKERQYVCRVCGFTGWSTHIDLERKAANARPSDGT